MSIRLIPSRDAEALAAKTADAYSADVYSSWAGVAEELLRAGYNATEAEALMRSKWMRWAADSVSASSGVDPRVALEYVASNVTARELRSLVSQTFEV